MRKIIGWVLLALGAFLLVVGLMAAIWAPGQVKRTPLDTDSTTRLAGTADKLNPATGDIESLDVKATSITKADSKRSDDEVIVFVNTLCLVIDEGDVPDCVDADDPQKRLISASTDVFATDRSDAMAVNGEYLPAGAEEKEGLINKWPFDAEKKDYPYWDRTPYVEVDDETGRVSYVEHHRTLGDWVRLLAGHGFRLVNLVEPEWPANHDRVWGGWSRTRGLLTPGTAIFVADLA